MVVTASDTDLHYDSHDSGVWVQGPYPTVPPQGPVWLPPAAASLPFSPGHLLGRPTAHLLGAKPRVLIISCTADIPFIT